MALSEVRQTVSSVAAAVTPHVASLRIGSSAGSAVVFADDGLLLTNVHIVGSVHDGVAAFTDGTESRFDVVGRDPCLTSRCSEHGAPRVLGAGRKPVTDAQGIQRQLFSEAIDTTLPITVLRNGAMVHVITELVAT